MSNSSFVDNLTTLSLINRIDLDHNESSSMPVSAIIYDISEVSIVIQLDLDFHGKLLYCKKSAKLSLYFTYLK